jgi:hypothetical protein
MMITFFVTIDQEMPMSVYEPSFSRNNANTVYQDKNTCIQPLLRITVGSTCPVIPAQAEISYSRTVNERKMQFPRRVAENKTIGVGKSCTLYA